MKALVVGGTGATGREVIAELLQSSTWTSIISIGRRNVELPPEYKNLDKSKLKEVVIDMDQLEKSKDNFQGVDAVFCTLGTTRKAAGRAEAFIKVDLGYVQATAKLAKEAEVPQFSLLTAQGSNANLWGPHFGLFHGLLYAQTKGKAEEFVKAQGFKRTSIFQPGLLIRNGEQRGVEKLFQKVVSSINVKEVAKAMVTDAEKHQGESGVKVFTMQDLKNQSSPLQ